jgi:hypothetical protein
MDVYKVQNVADESNQQAELKMTWNYRVIKKTSCTLRACQSSSSPDSGTTTSRPRLVVTDAGLLSPVAAAVVAQWEVELDDMPVGDGPVDGADGAERPATA